MSKSSLVKRAAQEFRANPRDWIVAVAAVFAAVGTVAAAFLAEFQLSDARKLEKLSFVAQERAQAEGITAWPYATDRSGFPESRGPHGGHVTYIELINTSSQPVYQAVVSLVFVQGAAPRTALGMAQALLPNQQRWYQRTLAVIPPGKSWTYVQGGWAGMFRQPGAEIGFTDQSGRSWIRWASGRLTQIQQPARTYYEVPEPAEWLMPQTNEPTL